METPNQRKNRLLGQPYGTATSKLRKMLMFDMAKRLDEDICYRCGIRIENLEDFSIEHTIAWQGSSNPQETFFDLSKIAYSHLRCNVAAGSYPHHKKYGSIEEKEKAKYRRRWNDPQKYSQHLEDKKERYHKNKSSKFLSESTK